MAIDIDKKWLNCKADFQSINLDNVNNFVETFKDTVPVMFVHNHFKGVCYYKIGNLTEDISCDKGNELPSKGIIEEATTKYILEHPELFSKDHIEERDKLAFAGVKLQEEMCAFTPDPGPASGVTIVTTVVGVGALCLLGYTIFNCVAHGVHSE